MQWRGSLTNKEINLIEKVLHDEQNLKDIIKQIKNFRSGKKVTVIDNEYIHLEHILGKEQDYNYSFTKILPSQRKKTLNQKRLSVKS